MVDNRRELMLLVPDSACQHVLATTDGRLPRHDVSLAPQQPTIAAAVAAASAVTGQDVPIVEIHFDFERDADAGPIPVLVVTETVAGEPPDGLRWIPAGVAGVPPESGLGDRLAEWVTEWSTHAEPPPLRARWSRHGWHARATAWVTDRLAALGRPPTGPIEQVRHWGISALLRAPTADGAAWFKAVFPPFHHEPAVTELLAASVPEAVPRVLATEPDEGWLLTDDLGTTSLTEASEAPGTVPAAAATVVQIQLRMAHRTGELIDLGCPARPLDRTVEGLRELFEASPRLPGVPDDVVPGALLERVAGAIERVAALGAPDTLVHGDFHAGNVAVGGRGTVIYDWSDAAIGNPLVDLATWPGSWLGPDVRSGARDALLRAWADAGVADERRLRDRLGDLVTVGAAYQAISYGGITRALEPARRREMADGIDHFVRIAASEERE